MLLIVNEDDIFMWMMKVFGSVDDESVWEGVGE